MTFTVPNVLDAAFPPQSSLDSGDLTVLAAGALTGVMSGAAVTAQATPNMTVAVAAGVVRIGGRRVAVTAGNVTITTANATNPRHDLITVDTSGALAAVAGTPAAITTTSEPVFPTIPANRAVLAAIYVPSGDTAIDASQVTDKRVTITDPGVEDVRWYGAVGDGSTDDTTAVQAAITAAQATGGNRTVAIPALTFSISGVTASADYVRIVGQGLQSVLSLRAGSNAYLVTVSKADTSNLTGFVLRDVELSCNCYGQTAASGGVRLVNASDFKIDGVYAHEYYTAGIQFASDSGATAWSSNGNITRCRFSLGKNSADAANTGYGIDLVDGEENFIAGNYLGFNGKAHIHENVVGNNSIIGNTFIADGIGISTNGSRTRIEGNIFDAVQGDNILLVGADCMVIGNAFYDIGRNTSGTVPGIHFHWQASGHRIIGNIFESVGGTSQTRSFIYNEFNNTSLNVIANNRFNQSARATLNGAVERSAALTSDVYRDNTGLNPVGNITAPTLPATATAYTNQSGYDCTVYIAGGTVSAVSIGGVTTGLTTNSAHRVPAGQTITVAYTVAPAWKWFAD